MNDKTSEVKDLILRGNQILSSVKTEDIFGINSPQECVDQSFLPFVIEWYEDLVNYATSLPNGDERDTILSLWIYNGRRVSTARISKAIDILENKLS